MIDDGGPLFNARAHTGVAVGICVLFTEDKLTYAGPLRGAPDIPGNSLVLLSPPDFAVLRDHLAKKRQ